MFLLSYPSLKVDYLPSIVLVPLEKQWMQKQDTYSPGDNQRIIPMYKELKPELYALGVRTVLYDRNMILT